jgi:hypothetical protein
MKHAIRKTALAALSTLCIASPFASASGIVEVYNESPVLIQPYFKSTCWGWALAGATGWIYFGNIAPNGGRFGWDFGDPALTDPACAHPVIEFTYGTDGVAPPDPQKGNRRAAVHFSPDTNTVFQIGKSFYGKELEGPGESGR